MSKASPAPKPKGSFAPSSFSKLRSLAGEGNGEPLRISLADIDEDPHQPRKAIAADDLEPMAATIRSHGVLQPIGLHPPVEGRYQLAFGARRLRASHMAGKLDIPAIIVPEGQRNYASQVIENQQRANLSNTDLAAAVLQLYEGGSSIEQIAVLCNLKEHAVAAFRAAAKFPEFLAERLDTADMRALYDLYRQWSKTPAEIEAAMPDAEAFITITDARRIISAINGKPTGSIAVIAPSRVDNENIDSHDGNVSIESSASPAGPVDSTDSIEPTPTRPALEPAEAPSSQVIADRKRNPSSAATIIVAIGDGETGELVTRRADTEGWGLVRYKTGIEEVELRQLRIIAIE